LSAQSEKVGVPRAVIDACALHLSWACERSQADCLITVEPRLWRDLRTWRGIPILKPTEALMHLGLDARRAPSCPE